MTLYGKERVIRLGPTDDDMKFADDTVFNKRKVFSVSRYVWWLYKDIFCLFVHYNRFPVWDIDPMFSKYMVIVICVA